MINYSCIEQQEFSNGEYKLVPIRFEDRYAIMNWRNEQIYHLRQEEPLTIQQQEDYFKNVVSKLFYQKEPNQILFSFLRDGVLIGYGGLVHINWKDKNAEVSFLTSNFNELELWKPYLNLLKNVAFQELKLTKIFTYAYDIRMDLYGYLREANFVLEGVFSNQISYLNKPLDVRIHACYNEFNNFWSRQANFNDAKLIFNWINDLSVRSQSLRIEPIQWEEHLKWFWGKLQEDESRIFIYYHENQAIGNLRFDLFEGKNRISYLVAESFRGKGFGKLIIEDAIERSKVNLLAEVRIENFVSNRIFEDKGFQLIESKKNVNIWLYVK
jgi:RimJ/RimL family protein N-acetyltransferase